VATFILLDTETTGTQEEDRICQLAFLAMTGKEVKPYDDYCKPPLAIKFGAMAVHNITPEMVEDKPPYHETEAAKALEALNTPENIMVIQNAPFDLGMLEKEGFTWNGKLIDTLRCAKHLLPEMESHGLQYLRYALEFYKTEKAEADKLGVEIRAHDALGDVLVLKMLMSHIVNLADRNIEKLVTLTKTPILVRHFRFGKYKNEPLEALAKKDRGYLEWALANMDLDEDMRYSIKRRVLEAILEKSAAGIPAAPADLPYLSWAREAAAMLPDCPPEAVAKAYAQAGG